MNGNQLKVAASILGLCSVGWLPSKAGDLTVDNLTVNTNSILRGPVLIGSGSFPSTVGALEAAATLNGYPNGSAGTKSETTYTGNSGSINYYGQYSVVGLSPSANVYDLAVYGLRNQIYKYGTNSIDSTDLYPLRGTFSNVGVDGSGTVSGSAGFYSWMGLEGYQGSGKMIRLAHFFAQSPYRGTGTGTIATAYGVYINDQKQSYVSNAFGIYQTGASDTNYFNGFVGLGTSSPSARLHVSGGDIKVSSGQFSGNGGGLLIPSQGDLSMGPFTAGTPP